MRLITRFFPLVAFMVSAAWAQSISISSPGSSSTSPVRVAASASSSSSIGLMQIYVDGSKKYERAAASIDTQLSMSSGTHRITIVAHDQDSYAKKTAYVSVSGLPSTESTSSAGQTVISRIEELSGWDYCDECSGPGGAGDSIYHSMSRGNSSPSIDGNSTRFTIAANSSSDDYGSALWWKHLGGKDSSSNFVYEAYFYIKEPHKAQALEFDINQSHDGDNTKYIFGTECDIRGTGQWRYYDNYNRTWRTTGVACSRPTAYTWNHVVLEFRRSSDDRLQFVALTLNGKKSYFNKSSAPKRNTASNAHINIAFQMDGNSRTEKYDVWLDKLTLRHW